MEVKAWVKNFEGEYQITTSGNLYSWKTGEPVLVKPTVLRHGHHSVLLIGENLKERRYIHRLVWETFKRERLKKSDWIYHINGDLDDNRLVNLRKKITGQPKEKPKKIIRYYVETEDGGKKGYSTIAEITQDYGINYQKAKSCIKTGEWVEIETKKNL